MPAHTWRIVAASLLVAVFAAVWKYLIRFRPGQLSEDHTFANIRDINFEALNRRLKARVDAHRTPVIVHVGPNNLNETEEVALYEQWLPFSPRVIFVEPNPPVVENLRARLLDLGLGHGRAQVVPAAMCTENTTTKSFYRFSERILQEFPLMQFYHVSEGGSVTKGKYQATWMDNFATFKNPGYSREEWARMLDYVEEIHVRCHTPMSLLREMNVHPADIDVLIIDAEGQDTSILVRFLGIPDFSPALIMSEWAVESQLQEGHRERVMHPMIQGLVQRGYAVHVTFPDIVAIAENFA